MKPGAGRLRLTTVFLIVSKLGVAEAHRRVSQVWKRQDPEVANFSHLRLAVYCEAGKNRVVENT